MLGSWKGNVNGTLSFSRKKLSRLERWGVQWRNQGWFRTRSKNWQGLPGSYQVYQPSGPPSPLWEWHEQRWHSVHDPLSADHRKGEGVGYHRLKTHRRREECRKEQGRRGGMKWTLSLWQARHHVHALVLRAGMASGFPVVGTEPSVDEYKIIIEKVK